MSRWSRCLSSINADLDKRRMIFIIRRVNVKEIKDNIKEEGKSIKYKVILQ